MKEFGSLSALVIEPHAGMRGSLHNMLNLCGVTKVDHAVSSGTAIRPLRHKTYDIILCEYDLADGQDGQQLLEDLRHNKLIPLWTIFFMVTAERAYEKVVSAAEQAPTDYLLKPFTADTLLERLSRAVERRSIFMPVHSLMDQGDIVSAVKACEEGEAAYPRYAPEFMRLRADLCMRLGRPQDAQPIYEKAQTAKGAGWARLGLAKTLFMQERFSEAEEMLTSLIQENSKFLDAYDWLAKTQEAIGKFEDAKTVLESAVSISPHTVHRLRKLGEVAFESGDVETAERSFRQVVSKARYSEFRDPEDHVRLVQALVTKGDTEQAAGVIRDMDKSLASLSKTAICRAFSAAMVHEATGNVELAMQHLSTAVEACRESVGLSNDIKMALAKSCLENDLEQGASEVMLDVMNNATDQKTQAKAVKMFEAAGKHELVSAIAEESRRQVIELVGAGAEKARQGDYRGAVDLMTKAASKMPENPQVVFNAALAVLKCLENLGWDGRLGEQGKWYIENARRLDPANPRLLPLGELYMTILKKYGVSPSQVGAKPAA